MQSEIGEDFEFKLSIQISLVIVTLPSPLEFLSWIILTLVEHGGWMLRRHMCIDQDWATPGNQETLRGNKSFSKVHGIHRFIFRAYKSPETFPWQRRMLCHMHLLTERANIWIFSSQSADTKRCRPISALWIRVTFKIAYLYPST
jgi:hypothetical protein